VTGASWNNSTAVLTFTRNDGDTFSVTLLDTLSDVTVTGGTYDSGTQTLELTKNDGSTISVSGFAIDTDINYYLTGSTFNTSDGVLTLKVKGSSDVTVDLDGRYLTGYTETDPIFSASPSANIADSDIENWNLAHGWGDHSQAGYLTTYNNEYTTGATFNSSNGIITFTRNDGDTFTVDLDGRYLTSYSETDTLDSVVSRGNTTARGITLGSGAPWAPLVINASAGEGTANAGVAMALDGTDYAEYGYRFKANGSNYYQVLYNGSSINWKHYSSGYSTKMSLSNGGNLTLTGTISASGYNDSNWNTAYGWGDHSQVGYLTSYNNEYTTGATFNAGNGIITFTRNDGDTFTVDIDGRFLTSYSETDTLNTVTSRGSTTSNSISVGDFQASHQSAQDATTKAEMLSMAVAKFKPHSTNSGTLAIAQVDNGNSVGLQYTNGAGTADWDMSLQPFGGNVGINKINPSGALHVYSGTSERFLISGDVHVQGSTDLNINGTSRRFSFTSGTGTIRTTTANELYLQTNSTTAITIDTNQNVTIGGELNIIKNNVGISTGYATVAIEATDAQLDLTSSSDGTWGSSINLVEGTDTTANTDVWSIARKTTNGEGDSSLNFNFGTANQHDNTARVIFTKDGAGTFTGNISANNLSGTNTGDQDLSGYLLNTTDTFTGNLTFNGGNNTSKESFINVKRGNGAGLWLKFQTDSTSANDVSQFVIRRSTDNVDILSITAGSGNLSVPGTLSASGYNDSNWNTAYGWGDHSTQNYLKGSNSSGTYEGTVTDWNSPTVTGFYSDDGATNRWSGQANWTSIMHVKLYDDNNNYATQIGFNTYDDGLYTRTNVGGTWTSWKQIYHSGVFTNNSSNWDTAYGWGDHSQAGYLTTYNNEYVTGASWNSSTAVLTFTRNDGDTFNVNLLNTLSDVTVTGGTYNSGNQTLTLTKSDGNTVSVSGFAIDTDVNYYTTGATFNTGNGIITGTRNDGGTWTVDIDNRYLQLDGGVLTGNIGRSAHNNGFLVGGYNNVGVSASATNPIFTIGTSYLPAVTTLGNMYGIGYTRADASFMGIASGSGWGMYVAADGDARIWLDGSSGNIVASGTLSASGYNDSNWNTAYGWGDHSQAGYLTTYNNEYTTGATFNTGNGIITFTRNDGDTYSVDIDGRYSLSSHTHSSFGDMVTFETARTLNEDWENSPISVLERDSIGNGDTSDTYSPNINFHWRSRVSRSIWMDYTGDFHFGEYTAQGVPGNTGAIYVGGGNSDQWNTAYGWGDHAGLYAAASHNHDSRYYTETEIDTQNTTLNETLAHLRGWVPGYSNSDDGSVRWNRTEDALELQSSSDTATGAVYKARRVEAGETIRFTVMVKGSSAGTAGLYLRIYQHDGNLPDGKTHVSNDAGGVYVQEDDRGDTGWYENDAIATTWITHVREYTAPVDGYVSLVVLNWTSIGNGSVYLKTPDIQTTQSPNSNKLDGLDSSQFLRSDAADSLTATITMSTQKAFVASNYGHGVYGTYDASKYQHVWSMGTSYNLPADGDSSGNGGNLYGLAWSYNPDYGYVGSNTQSKNGLNHQLLLMMNGVTHTALGSGIWTDGTIITTSHGDSSQWNTAYGWGDHGAEGYWTSHADTSTLSGQYGGANNGVVIEDITVDSNGHVTAVGTRDLDGRFLGISATAADSDKLDAYQLAGSTSVSTVIFNNKGQIHDTNQDFNTVMTPGPNYMRKGINGPTGVENDQWYGLMLGLGSDYGTSTGSSGHYGNQLYWGRQSQGDNTYLWARDMEGGSWGSWRKMSAGYADSAGSATSAGNADTLDGQHGSYYTNAGNLTGTIGDVFSASTRYNIGFIDGSSSQSRDKLRVWADGSYSIGMKNGYDFGHLGSGEYAMSFQMDTTPGRGWWWGTSTQTDDQGVMALTNDGRLNVSTSISIGEGKSTTSPSTTPLYVEGTTSGSTVFEVQGTQGQLFSITDDLSGDLFEVSDISGIPILTVNASGTVTIDDTLHVTGDVIAYYSSDERLKDNVKPIENAIDKIRMISGYEFDWNSSSKNEGHDIGVIAQEVEKILPEVVTTRSNGYKAVRYEKLTALLIQSNKELIEKVEELEKKLKNK
jgi:hypothetical protein